MCGIAGYTNHNDEILKKMTDTLHHRGPDGEGFYFDENIAMGFRRLSIIDISGGSQPIFNEDKNVVTIFNGEIYNFKELRKNLEARGHKFYTQTDTEVIVHQYEEDGEKCFEKFNGMFAIAIWDKKEKKLILARDRMGKKPLYYFWDGKNFIFGSELKTLKAHPDFHAELDFASINKYFTYDYIPTPHSIFKNTFKLRAGSLLIFKAGNLYLDCFWDISFSQKFPLLEKEILEKMDFLIDDAVKIRLVSDVPLGVFLSGGIDSSAIAYYAQKNFNSSIDTFSIGFEESSFDESEYARTVAAFLGTKHHSEILSPSCALELIPHIADFLDEPMADPSIIPTYFLSKFTKENVTVALGGDGGDEIFMGYPTYLVHQLADFYKRFPKFLQKNVNAFINDLPADVGNMSLSYKAKKFITGLNESSEYRNQIWLGNFSRGERALLFRPDIWEDLKDKNEFDDIDCEIVGLENDPVINKIIKLYQRHYMMDEVLVKVDRASMAASLEIRAPFLDYRLVEFLNSIPFDQKIKKFQTKYLLKKLMANKLPKEIIHRPKKGFSVPLAKWFNGQLREFIALLLSKDNIDKEGIFNYDFIRRLIDDHFNGKRNNARMIWDLVVFEMWRKKWYN